MHVLDRFDSIQFFTEALRSRRYVSEAKKHHHVRFIDRCLTRRPRNVTEEERGFVTQWCQKDEPVKHLDQSLQHMRYVLKSSTRRQAERRLNEWFKPYPFHDCGAISKVAKTLIAHEEALLDAIISPLSNGIMEGTNNKFKLIKRRGLGTVIMPIFSYFFIWKLSADFVTTDFC
ncbi:transposase [Bacillus xiapuensis]|uniref:transposase n=1 Tax=Bacillus xiapuensis TaxID=2014075 RepID=UPI000C24567F|nr:transposase [Bacillus xiapuensis]